MKEYIETFKDRVTQKYNSKMADKVIKTIYNLHETPIPDILVCDSPDIKLYDHPIIAHHKRKRSDSNHFINPRFIYADVEPYYGELSNVYDRCRVPVQENYDYDDFLAAISIDDTKIISFDSMEELDSIASGRLMPSWAEYTAPFINAHIAESALKKYKMVNFLDIKSKILCQLMDAGIFCIHASKQYCIIVKNPTLSFDNQGRLHNKTGPAVKFGADFKRYYFDGVEVPKRWITNPKSVTSEDIRNIRNAEQNAILVKILGADTYFNKLGNDSLHLLDEDVDNQGNPMKLWYMDLETATIRVLQCVCPSTQRTYYIAPPDQSVHSVWRAKASTFGISVEECQSMMVET